MTDPKIPYVISADLPDLFTRWSNAASIAIPPRVYFLETIERIRKSLNDIFEVVLVVDDNTIKDTFRNACNEVATPIISIDRIYMPDIISNTYSGFLDITRAVDQTFDPIGLVVRPPIGRFDAKIESLKDAIQSLPIEYTGKEVTLVDDVVYSGGTITTIIAALADRSIQVSNIIAGISIGSARDILTLQNIKLRSGAHFDNVIDEVCSRDFVVGAPYGGRTTILRKKSSSSGKSVSNIQYAPYLLPFGNPKRWATIPEDKALPFSLELLDISIDLWDEVEKINKRPISTQELGCRVYNLPSHSSVTMALRSTRDSLELCL